MKVQNKIFRKRVCRLAIPVVITAMVLSAITIIFQLVDYSDWLTSNNALLGVSVHLIVQFAQWLLFLLIGGLGFLLLTAQITYWLMKKKAPSVIPPLVGILLNLLPAGLLFFLLLKSVEIAHEHPELHSTDLMLGIFIVSSLSLGGIATAINTFVALKRLVMLAPDPPSDKLVSLLKLSQ